MPDTAVGKGALRPVNEAITEDLFLIAGEVYAVKVVEIDVIGIQPLQRGIEETIEIVGAVHLRHGKLGGDEHLIAEGLESPADGVLTVAVAVAPGGVKIIDTQLHGPAKQGDGELVVNGLATVLFHHGKAHAAKAQRGDALTALSEIPVLHDDLLQMSFVSPIITVFFLEYKRFSISKTRDLWYTINR